MTREEAIEIIESECYVFSPFNLDRSTRINTALDMMINALEQEPCEDAISRKALLNMYECLDEDSRVYSGQVVRDIKALPPVTPTRKKGKWIDTKEISMNSRGQIVHEVICSECNGISYFRGIDGKYIGANLCSNCGAEMEKGEKINEE